MGSNGRKFHSSYIIDVSSEPVHKRVRLTDSMRATWFIDTSSPEKAEMLKHWLNSAFFKGVPNTLTVFEYEDLARSECEIENYIIRFINMPKKENQLNG